MKFKIISLDVLKENLSNFLMYHYHEDFANLKKFVFLDISQILFNDLRKRSVREEELKQLINNFNKNQVEKNLIRIGDAWQKNESSILENIEKLTGLKISTQNITCFIDPYTNLGFYDENSISIGSNMNFEAALMVISHELFHIFYWNKLKEMGLTVNMEHSNNWEWKLSEVTVYLLQKEELLTKFWQNTKIELYPEIEEVYNSVKDLWKMGTFEDYLNKSYYILENENK